MRVIKRAQVFGLGGIIKSNLSGSHREIGSPKSSDLDELGI